MARLDFGSEYRYQPPPGVPRGIPRPYLPVRLHRGPATTREILALVDSGADVSAFHMSVAQQLNIDIAGCRRLAMLGVGGAVTAYACEVEIELEGRRFLADVRFVQSRTALLGREDVFMQFRFAFDQRARTLLVEPY